MSTLGCMAGGRRRRSGKKSRKMRGGNMYGVVGGDPQLGTAGARYDAVANLPVNSATGAVSNVDYGMAGGRRRRRTSKKSRKGGKHRRGHKSRKMRGGMTAGQVGYGFNGTGEAGLAHAAGYNANVGGAPTGADGVARV